MFFMLFNHIFGFLCALFDNFLYLSVHLSFYFFTIRLGILTIRESNISNIFTHTKFRNNFVCQIISFLKIVVSSSSDFIKKVQLSTSTSKNETNSINKLLLCLKLILVDKILCETESSLRSWNNSDFQ